jgi:hypothetical protein
MSNYYISNIRITFPINVACRCKICKEYQTLGMAMLGNVTYPIENIVVTQITCVTCTIAV